MTENPIVVRPPELVERIIWTIRDQKVIMDWILAELYGVETKILLQAVKRNINRFPSDFMFQLTRQELTILRSQFVTSRGWGGRRYLPYAFTEQGVAMLSSVLNSDRAVEVNIAIMRAFVQLRRMMQSHKELSKRLDDMERKYDEQFRIVFDAIRKMMAPPTVEKKGKMGF
ncbi:MAG: ORF6N domain-containing protein [Calditrichota bacterium]